MKRVTGKVVFRDLGAGSYELHAEGGARFQLAGAAFHDGETVTVEGEVDPDAMGTAMVGLPLLRVRRVLR